MKTFDRFACWASAAASRAPFFVACVLIVIVWLPTLIIMSVNTSELIINTVTTIITFLLVALLQNSQQRFENAMNHKLNAIADFLADFAEATPYDLQRHVEELREAVGVEGRISA
jgi:low affinity Fe/Cu permease